MDSLLYDVLLLCDYYEYGLPNGTGDSCMKSTMQIDSEIDTPFREDRVQKVVFLLM